MDLTPARRETVRADRALRLQEILDGFPWKHRIVIRYAAAGFTNRAVAKEAGYTEQWVATLLAQDDIRAAVEDVQALNAEHLDSNVDYRNALSRIRNEVAPDLYLRLLGDSNTPPDVLRKILLDIADQTGATSKSAPPPSVDPEVATQAKRTLADIADIARAVRTGTLDVEHDRDPFAIARDVTEEGDDGDT